MAPYRPSGRSGRAGRSQADNDIFEGLPVKQWTTLPSRISLAPQVSEATAAALHDKWADLPMPRDYQLLLPHTQALLRIARSGKFGLKRKAQPDVDADADEYGEREENAAPEEAQAKSVNLEDRGFVAKKWQPTPDAALVPEHLHLDFLAKRRKGLPSFYHGLANEVAPNGMPQIAKRKTRVQRVIDIATGESVIYEVLALEGQILENELPADSQMEALKTAPGTVVEGLGTANEEGLIVVVPVTVPLVSRRNRPPPKKKGGPGRGKKRVTFTNPDGSTYTTIVPNATKIVPKPGQTIKHVAKGETGGREVTLEEAKQLSQSIAESQGAEGGAVGENGAEGEGEGEGEGDNGDEDDEDDEDEDDDDEGDEDDDREDGEVAEAENETSKPEVAAAEDFPVTAEEDADAEMQDESIIVPPPREASSSPDLPLAKAASTHSRQNSLVVPPEAADGPSANEPLAEELLADELPTDEPRPDEPQADEPPVDGSAMAGLGEPNPEVPADIITDAAPDATPVAAPDTVPVGTEPPETFEDGDEDLLGSLERHLEG